LTVIDSGLLTDARMDDGFRGGEIRTGRPTAVLDAEHVQGKRFRTDGNDAIFTNDAVLLAATDEFAGEENEWAPAAIDEDELVDAGRSRELTVAEAAAVADHAARTLFADEDFAGSEAFFEGEEVAGVSGISCDDGKDGNVFKGNGIEEPPAAVAFG